MTASDQNPYQSPHVPSRTLNIVVPADGRKYLRRYSRCFWISLAAVAVGFAVAAIGALVDSRIGLGKSSLYLAFFPGIPFFGGLVGAITFGGLWIVESLRHGRS